MGSTSELPTERGEAHEDGERKWNMGGPRPLVAEFTLMELGAALMSVKNSKSSSWVDGISYPMIMQTPPTPVEGTVPALWKQAVVVPVLKT